MSRCPTIPNTHVEVSQFPLPLSSSHPLFPLLPLLWYPRPPLVLPRQSPQQPSALPRHVTVDSVGVGAGGAATGGTRSGGARSRGAGAGGAGAGGASSGGAGAGGSGTGGASFGGAGAGGAGTRGASSGGAGAGGASSGGVGAGGAGTGGASSGVSGLWALDFPSSPLVHSLSPTAYGPTFPPPDSTPAIFSPPQSHSPPPVVRHELTSRCPPRTRPSSPLADLCTVLFRSPPHRSPPVSFEMDFLAATSPFLCAMLLSLEGDPDALDIPTPRTYREAVSGKWASRWKAAMDAELASWRSTGTYVDAVPPHRANVVDCMWLFKVKRPHGSPPIFKARYVARGFSQCEGVDFFQTFAPTPKITKLWVLLHVAAQRDYELHSLNFSTALRRLVYDLRQSPRKWHDTIRSTLRDLGFRPSSADPSLFVRTGSTILFILVYINNLVFATADRAALAEVKSELQKRHKSFGGSGFSTTQPTPLAVDHRLTGPFPDEPFDSSGPYAELVGCLMYLMTCTRPDLAFPLSVLSCFVANGRHRPVHWTAAVRVAKYLATTSGMGLVLGETQPVMLTGHCDSSYADDMETQRSTQGYCFSLGAGAVSWRSTRSASVASSGAEA
ncbi:unnamed protein product [Closterium sp. NIES-53]